MFKVKGPAVAICTPIGIIMIIFGIVLILKSRKKEQMIHYNYSSNVSPQPNQQFNQQNQQERTFCTNCGTKISINSEFCRELSIKLNNLIF